jgi:hypothetical protein
MHPVTFLSAITTASRRTDAYADNIHHNGTEMDPPLEASPYIRKSVVSMPPRTNAH